MIAPADGTGAAPEFAQVILREPIGVLDYHVPEEIRGAIYVGTPVRVPLGGRQTTGFVVALSRQTNLPPSRLKDLIDVDPEEVSLPANLIHLVLFAADYYAVAAGEMLAAAFPRSRYSLSTQYRLEDAGLAALQGKIRAQDRALLELAQKLSKGFTLHALIRDLEWSRRAALSRVRNAVLKGWIAARSSRRQSLVDLAYVRIEGDITQLGQRRRKSAELWHSLPAGKPVLAATLVEKDPQALRKLAILVRAGLVQQVDGALVVGVAGIDAGLEAPQNPTDEQQQAIMAITGAIDRAKFETFLLAGVTGSGKTEVYLRVIDYALGRGRTALVLVPEIALTPQLGARFRARFGKNVAIFHSALTPSYRRQQWESVARGQARVALGARSALFLPMQGLGVVIVDEEHETTFKQDESPRYHARDMAIVRGQHDHAVVVLGSATPSMESLANVASKRYQSLRLTRRVLNRPMPQVECINLAREELVNDGALTVRLAHKLERVIAAGEQAILFLNRRGFAPYVYCRDCGYSSRCPDCAVGLTLHRRRAELLCHYCGHTEPVPDTCPECQGHRLDASGLGTERLEAQVRELLGEVAIGRLDRDAARRKSDLTRVLSDFASARTKILIGTQMVTKGHDFPGVTLVGVISADASLNFPDFRAAEHTFQLLSQVAGRAGRGSRAGLVLVQSYEPEHYAIAAAAAHDYERFVDAELPIRRELEYPPFAHLALLRFEGSDEPAVLNEAGRASEALLRRAAERNVQVLGPAPAPLARLKGLWRYQVLLKSQRRKHLRLMLPDLPSLATANVHRIVDIDPFNML